MSIIELNPIFYRIYHGNVWVVLLVTMVAIILWSRITFLCRAKNKSHTWFLINSGTLILSVGVIVVTTIMFRSTGKREVILTPFYTFHLAEIDPDYYRSMLMNILLFIPFGLSISTILPLKWNTIQRIAATGLLACLFSITIELTQYWLLIGTTEVDDVLANTMGAFVGAAQLLMAEKLWNRFDNNCSRDSINVLSERKTGETDERREHGTN